MRNQYDKYLAKAMDAQIYVERYNPGKNNPYHNTKHMFAVASTALRLYAAEAWIEGIEVTLEAQKIIFYAGIFHDFAHGGGYQTTDRDNIEAALKAAEWYLYVNRLEDILEEVKAIIRCTEYPYIIAPSTLIEKCIRDADVLYPAISRDPNIVMRDLRAELNLRRKLDTAPEITLQQMFEMQKAFEPEIFTKTGKAWWSELKPNYTTLIKEHYVLK